MKRLDFLKSFLYNTTFTKEPNARISKNFQGESEAFRGITYFRLFPYVNSNKF